eukprot:12897753-Prorocentrum_lima.AAC.1
MSSHARRHEQHLVVLCKRKLDELNKPHAAKAAAILANMERQEDEVERLQWVERRLMQELQDTENRIAL